METSSQTIQTPYRLLALTLIAGGMVLCGNPQTARADAPINLSTAQECTRHIPTMERLYNIPAHWLAAIASAESGRYHSQLRLSVPWPWTINAEGKGYWFGSKQEAIAAVQLHQSRGVKSIDVGCMQVNLMYHGKAFANLSQAFEPIYNISYAAKFLRQQYDRTNSWTKATAAYHSLQSQRGAEYYRKVYGKWQQVVDRMGDTTLPSASAPPVIQNASRPEPPMADVAPAPAPVFSYRPPSQQQQQVNNQFRVEKPPYRKQAGQEAVRMNSITVTRGNYPPVAPSVASPSPALPPIISPPPSQMATREATPTFSMPMQPRRPVNRENSLPLNSTINATVSEPTPTVSIPAPARKPLSPSRKYERGVLVVRATPVQASVAANEPAQARLASGESGASSMAESPVMSRGQFAPQTAIGNTTTPQPAPPTQKTASPQFVF
jgi:hypothetical protein